jgi:3-(3-hydroxy-phenyl)propionate hydroxylase
MTPPTRGWQLTREAALSLAISNEFPRGLANPRQMQPYTYSTSPLSCPSANEADFTGGPVCGAACPNVRLSDGRFLLDMAGDGFTGLLFAALPADNPENTLMDELKTIDRRFTTLVIDIRETDAAWMFDAAPGTFYLLRPDMHVAGRWKHVEAETIAAALRIGLGGTP